ncbi:hypothetical protein BJ138DRAFT_1140810 [Hygrophoropsis aurantiaca]|uniref:Uncharacterized protein n=1 Tax=Hygrophoropsis aurantiaca TaxID=72124 RepID=A0ACB8AU77_9AGAM|nr:hypothetical protein BJ138DRAFT_1140810 [Hygrophoropsis aurantiaca]
MKPTWKEKKGDGKTKGGSAKTRQNSDSATPARKRKRTKLADDQDKIDSGSDSDDAEVEVDLKEGQEVVGVVVKAPKTGWAPPGQVSKNTLDFLARLKDPACNDREWFKLNEPVYRRAETEFKAFIDAFSTMLSATDPQIPPLPPKDVIHRIYRDIRFSNDKTPYKTGFSASFSRSGRKGRFAFLKPGGESMFAAGAWCPGKDELALIRSHIQHTSLRDRLRSILAAPAFISRFGERAIFGREDELKVAPKGVGKDHRDIDLLKCRTLAVSCRLTDAQVLSSGFVDELRDFVEDVRPFVHCLNDMMTLPMEGFMNEDSDGGDGEGGDESED